MKKADYYLDRYSMMPSKNEQLSDRLNKVLKIFTNYNFRKIIDIGCGDGNFSSLLQMCAQAEEVCGVDISKNAVELANAKGVKAFELDIDEKNLPFKNDYFDALFCGELIEHLLDPDQLLNEVHRVLKPGGFAIITTPNLASWYNRISLLFGFQPYYADVSYKHCVGRILDFGGEVGGHLRLFTHRALKELLILHGFKVVKTIGSNNLSPVNLPKNFPKIFFLIERIFDVFPTLSSTPIFLCMKK